MMTIHSLRAHSGTVKDVWHFSRLSCNDIIVGHVLDRVEGDVARTLLVRRPDLDPAGVDPLVGQRLLLRSALGVDQDDLALPALGEPQGVGRLARSLPAP